MLKINENFFDFWFLYKKQFHSITLQFSVKLVEK